MNRRKFLWVSAAAAGATPLALIGYTVAIEPHWLELVRRDLSIRNLPAELQGRTLALLSDLHIGPQVSDEYMIESFDRTRALAPDLVVMTGDYLTHQSNRGEAQFSQLRSVLAHLPHGRLGTVAILGNHDYGLGWSDLAVANRVASELERAGIRVLRNEVATVRGLDIVGVDDLWAGQHDTRRALAARTSSAAIVLCHNPDAQDELNWQDYTGWVLAGHTHGGQCKPPFLPPPFMSVRNRRYTRGVVAVNDRRTLYISRGVGHLIKARFNVRPEITLFTMRPA